MSETRIKWKSRVWEVLYNEGSRRACKRIQLVRSVRNFVSAINAKCRDNRMGAWAEVGLGRERGEERDVMRGGEQCVRTRSVTWSEA